jgi:hypothetical protein
MKKHGLKIICVVEKYFPPGKKLFSCLFEKYNYVRGMYFDVQILYANTLFI